MTNRISSARCLFAISMIGFALIGIPLASAQPGEIATKDTAVTFKSGVNLVPVTVVVRDRTGHAVGNLGREDFQLFDNGKPQMISKFSVQKFANGTAPAALASQAPVKETSGGVSPADAKSGGIPDRFVAYFFDDLHMSAADLVFTRDAAGRQIDSSAHATERAAIYTTSGQVIQSFTGDKEKLHAALLKMGAANSTFTRNLQQSSCPPMTYYMGDRITNRNDADALAIAVADTMVCANLEPPQTGTQQPLAQSDFQAQSSQPTSQQEALALMLAKVAARNASMSGDKDANAALDMLRSLVKEMAAMPGQRIVVMVSEGFPVTDERLDKQAEVIEQAVRANVVIGGLDARGLYPPPSIPDATQSYINAQTLSQRGTYLKTEALLQSDVMATFADGTGGTFFHDSNDYDEGIARTAAAPEYLYVLGFSPLDLKLDGKYHNLRVALAALKGMDVQVRKGYFAPRSGTSPEEKAKEEIEEAFFSHDEVHDLSAALQTQFFSGNSGEATLTAVAKIDVKKLAFRKDAGRNLDTLTVLTGLFDNDGNYVDSIEKTVELRFLDETLGNRVAGGMSLKSSFSVHSGRYMVRLVVRDSEGQMMSAQSGLVDIP